MTSGETMRPAPASQSALGSERRVTIGSAAAGGFSMMARFESRPACPDLISGACCNMQPQREECMRGAERFRIGDYDCWTLADGELTYPGWTVLPPEGDGGPWLSG